MRALKDSGIEWIGDIPSDWKVMPHKYIMHKQKDICEHYNGEDIISLTMGGVIVRDLTAGGKMPTTFDGYQYVEPEDLLMCLFDIDVTPRCVGVVHNYGLTSPAYSRFKVHNGYHNAYYDYLLRFIDDEKVFIHLSKNLRSSLTETDFGAINTVVPPYEEQKKIADFLDRTCAEIDVVIEKTKATIEEYKKLKQSVITEAVTKGIYSDRAMKDSGIEWIGDIPAEWKVSKLKYVCQINTEFVDPRTGEFDDLPHIGPGNIEKFTGRLTEYKYVKEEGLISGKYHFRANEIVYGKINPQLGKVTFPQFEGLCSADAYPIHTFEQTMRTKFLLYFMLSRGFIDATILASLRMGMPKINSFDLMCLSVIVPSLEEQQKIIDFLDSKCAEIDKLIADKTHLLEEMESYKKSVIYEYVTGKKEIFV